MGAVATFSFPTFAARYPEFATLDPVLVGLYFTEAGLYLANDGTGPVADVPTQTLLTLMLVAHIAKLNATIVGRAPSGLVGRISSASEGSVSVSTDNGPATASAAWFQQTAYGSAFWSATARYRLMRYVAGSAQPSGYPYGYRQVF